MNTDLTKMMAAVVASGYASVGMPPEAMAALSVEVALLIGNAVDGRARDASEELVPRVAVERADRRAQGAAPRKQLRPGTFLADHRLMATPKKTAPKKSATTAQARKGPQSRKK